MRVHFRFYLCILAIFVSVGTLGADTQVRKNVGHELGTLQPNQFSEIQPLSGLFDGKASLRERLLSQLTPGLAPSGVVGRLLNDYVTYHMVFLGLGGLSLVLFLVLFGYLIWHFSGLPLVEGRWGFRKTVAFCLALSSGLLSLGLALVVFANATTVLDPNPGFLGSISLIPNPTPGSRAETLHQAYLTWLESGVSEVPPFVQQNVNERLAWQVPKAWFSLGSLILSALMSWLAWRSLGKRFSMIPWKVDLRSIGLLTVAVFSTLALPLLLAMVIGNSQGALAPLALSLFFA